MSDGGFTADGLDDLVVTRAANVDVESTAGGTVDVEVSVEVARVSTIDVIAASGPTVQDVSTSRFTVEDIAIGIPGEPGPPGPAGPPGPGYVKQEYRFATASTAWVIHHNLGTPFIEVNCYDPSGVNEIDAEVDIVDDNTVQVNWYYPTAGIARLIG